MLQALLSIERGSVAIPFVRMFYYLWEDNEGHVHREQGEGGEQGDLKKGCWRFTMICTL